MAWKRGVQNNQAGLIRKGHIREFLLPSSRDQSISFALKILDTSYIPRDILGLFPVSPMGYMNFDGLQESIRSRISTESVGILYLHAHDHPSTVLAIKHSPLLPHQSIALSESHRCNAKVCTGELQEFTVYQGEVFAYDAREGAIGDTELRYHECCNPPALHAMMIDIRLRNPMEMKCVDIRLIKPVLARFFAGLIVSINDVYGIIVHDVDGANVEIVCTVNEVYPEYGDNSENDEEGVDESNEEVDDEGVVKVSVAEMCNVDDNYRGVVHSDTFLLLRNRDQTSMLTFLNHDPNEAENFAGQYNKLLNERRNGQIVEILTRDQEVFPVHRQLLRPCIALTSVVQQGRGKYKSKPESTSSIAEGTVAVEESSRPAVYVDVDACTFDRVLLYLEHEARGEVFRFDPLLAPELRTAAMTLRLQGLQDVCDRVLGSFQERVSRRPIRYQEVVARNLAGSNHNSSRRGETLLIMNGMVLDITRWLDEHPGGSTIIPQQALNVDSTVFFEIYHASRQSFLYLKEFYIGELALEDRDSVPKSVGSDGIGPSVAFLEHLDSVTKWRLKPEDLIQQGDKVHKSF